MKYLALLLALLVAGGCKDNGVHRIEWISMGTVAAVQFRGGETDERKRIAAEVREVFSEIEKLLNAHDSLSELSMMRTFGDGEILTRCSALVRPCYEAAFKIRDQTSGRFDPRWKGGKSLDLGAIAKGFAVDLACERIAGARMDVLVDLGGNLKAVSGNWRTLVAGSHETLELTPGMACATSAEYFRGKHIKNARDGSSPLAAGKSVTVVHPSSAMTADALSTVMFIMGEKAGVEFALSHYPEVQMVWTDGKSDAVWYNYRKFNNDERQ